MFKKYPSLTNHYHSKDIDYFTTKYGDEMREVTWQITEKIHGANFSILFTPNSSPNWFSRNQQITNANFYNCEDLILEYVNKLKIAQNWVNQTNRTFRVFGELYGPGIQKGVDYGPERKIRFYDLMIDDMLVPQQEFENFFYDHGLGSLMVPIIGRVGTLEEGLEFDSRFDSKLSTKEGNICEGIVIKPYEKVFVDSQGSVFYIKKKNEEFKEKQKVKKERTETQYTEEVNKWHNEFLSYINKNRAESVFSKEGEISSFKDIGKYISLIHQDALDDFNKEHSDDFVREDFTKKELKHIFNSSKDVVKLLKEYL